MSDYTTNFPPQTYSSSFYINSLVDGEKSSIFVKPNNADRDGTKGPPLLDCFISAMSGATKKIQKLFYFSILLSFLAADASKVCKMDNHNTTVTFPSLLEFQASTYSFDPDDQRFKGNIVDFNFKSIDRLPRNSFISFGSEGIIKISLNNKGIRTIDGGAFTNLFCLHYLELRGNNISSLITEVFSGLDNLRMLDLSGNALRRISQNGMTFNSLNKLKTLNLSKNSIITLNAFDFFNLTSLEVLELSFNRISIIPIGSFNSLRSLKELFLNNNKLSYIEPEKWVNLKKFDPTDNFVLVNLQTLNVSRNFLNSLNVINLKRSLPNLKKIDISLNDWYCYDLEIIKHQLADSKITVLDGNCSTSEGYIRPTTESPTSTASNISPSTISASENKNTTDYLKKVFIQNDEVLSTTNKVLQNVRKLQTLLGFLCAIVVILVLVNVVVRIRMCQNLYNRMAGRLHADDGNDRERLLLLRP